MSIGIIILAAGSSSRMGKVKQLLPINGEPMIRRAVNCALGSKGDSVVIVLGSNEKDNRAAISDLRVTIIGNNDWHYGMGNSLKAGIKQLDLKQVNAVIVMVCDQPAVTPDHLNKLIEKYISSHKVVIASRYADTAGVPVLLDRNLFKELLSIDDAHGAKSIINRHNNDLELVDLPGGEIDLDTPEEYQRYVRTK